MRAMCLGALLACGLALAPPATADELSVCVALDQSEQQTAEQRDQLKARREALASEREALEESLKAEHGKKKEAWPEEKRAELEGLASELSRLAFESAYGANADEKLEKSVKGLSQNVASKKKHLRLVSSREEADLVIEVVGRYLGRDAMGEATANIGFKVVPGGRLDTACLDAKPVVWPEHAKRMAGAWAVPAHQYSSELRYWLLDVSQPCGRFGPMYYGKVEKHMAGSVEKLAKEKGDAVVACRKPATAP